MSEMLPVLLLKDNKLVLGQSQEITVECNCYIKEDNSYCFNVKIFNGNEVVSDGIYYDSNNFEFNVASETVINMKYIGNLPHHRNGKICHVFADQDRKVYTSIVIRQWGTKQFIVYTVKLDYFKFKDYEGFCLGVNPPYPKNVKVINDYLIISHKEFSYVFEDLNHIKFQGVSAKFLYHMLQLGYNNNRIKEYFNLLHRLIGLSNLKKKLGGYNISRMLNSEELTIQQVERFLQSAGKLIDSPELIEEVICGIARPNKQIHRALEKVDSVDPLITNPKHLKEIQDLTIVIYPKSVYVKLRDLIIARFSEKLYDGSYDAACARFLSPEDSFHKYLWQFCNENSLSSKLSQKQISAWAGLLKHLDKSQIIYQNGE